MGLQLQKKTGKIKQERHNRQKEVEAMRSNNRLIAAKVGYIIISVLLCVLGIVLIAVPDVSLRVLTKACGAVIILFGVIKIVGYCARDRYRLAFQFDLASGIMLMAVGVILIIRTGVMIHFISAIMGICVLTDALLKIQTSIDSRAFGIRGWWMILAAALLTGIIGFLLIFRPTESTQIIMILLGISLITEGVLNLLTILTVVKIVRFQSTEIIDM